MSDLTILFMTVNKVPKEWAKYHKRVLLEAIGDLPVISVTKEPSDWGTNLLQDEQSVENLFKQYLRACKVATTPYIAIAEDDTLYSKEHFAFRPPLDSVAYDMNRWVVRTWGEPFYYYKPHISNTGMIAPRELLIKALEERFVKYPHLNIFSRKEIGRYEKKCGLTEIPIVEYLPEVAFVGLNHVYSLEESQQKQQKKAWAVRAYDIPKWGRVELLLNKFK